MNHKSAKRMVWKSLMIAVLSLWIFQNANARFVDGSCKLKITGDSWAYYDIPANPPAGYVIAERLVIGQVSFRKSVYETDQIELGAGWFPYYSFNNYFKAATLPNMPGAGIRLAPLYGGDKDYYPGEVVFAARSTSPSSTNFTVLWKMDIVILEPKIFRGGTADRVNGLPLLVVKSTFSKNNPSSKPVCDDGGVISQGDVQSIGGGEPLKPIPPPSAPTCTATTENLNFTVDLPPITASSLRAIGDISAATTRNLVLTDCGANATPYVTFTDSNDRTNRTTNLTLSADSKASGVGIRLATGDHTVQLGAQNTTVSTSNVGQFLIGTSAADGSTLRLPLQAHYVRTGRVIPGKLKAGAIVTIVYP